MKLYGNSHKLFSPLLTTSIYILQTILPRKEVEMESGGAGEPPPMMPPPPTSHPQPSAPHPHHIPEMEEEDLRGGKVGIFVLLSVNKNFK